MLKKIRKAVTLVEVMIVVFILGILTTIAAPAFIKARQRSLNKEGVAYIKMLHSAVKMNIAERVAILNDCTSNRACNQNYATRIDSDFWDLEVDTTGPTTFTVTATASSPEHRVFTMDQSDTKPGCSNDGSTGFCFND